MPPLNEVTRPWKSQQATEKHQQSGEKHGGHEKAEQGDDDGEDDERTPGEDAEKDERGKENASREQEHSTTSPSSHRIKGAASKTDQATQDHGPPEVSLYERPAAGARITIIAEQSVGVKKPDSASD